MSEATTDAAKSASRKNPTWLVATIAGVFGLFYALAVWYPVGNLIQVLQVPVVSLTALGWFVWIFAISFPILAFAVAFSLGFRRPPAYFALIMLTGLAVTAVFWLNVLAYTATSGTSLLS